jgi:hypothetical protein
MEMSLFSSLYMFFPSRVKGAPFNSGTEGSALTNFTGGLYALPPNSARLSATLLLICTYIY